MKIFVKLFTAVHTKYNTFVFKTEGLGVPNVQILEKRNTKYKQITILLMVGGSEYVLVWQG